MNTDRKITGLQVAELEQILEVTRKLAAPFDLTTMLSEVVDSARKVLQADRGTVFLYDKEADELEMTVGTDMDAIRFPATQGIAGQCVQTREIINVPDCYEDSRFNPEFDRKSGYRTRCMLTLPLIAR